MNQKDGIFFMTTFMLDAKTIFLLTLGELEMNTECVTTYMV